MRRVLCVPMMLLFLLLSACGKTETEKADLREPYRDMTGCTMTATVSCAYDMLLWTGELRCDYVPGGETVIEVLAPETIVGIRAVLREEQWQLEYEDLVLAVDTLGERSLTPVTCLPRLMHTLREGWLLEENEESWGEIPCVRLALDESLSDGRKLVTALWLRQADGTPLRGEIALEEEIILSAEFTQFSFYDKIDHQESVNS